MNIKDELLRIVGALAAADIDYAVAGGLAVAIHGCPRLTVDVDILIRGEDLDRARAAMATIGFDLESGMIRLGTGPAGEPSLFRLVKAEGTEFLTLDLLMMAPQHEKPWTSREPFELGGRVVWVVSKDALIEMKRQAGRPQDLADIAALETESPPP